MCFPSKGREIIDTVKRNKNARKHCNGIRTRNPRGILRAALRGVSADANLPRL